MLNTGVLHAGDRHGCGNEENDTDEVSMDEGCLGMPGRPLFCEKIQKEDYVNVKEGTKELFQMLENLKNIKIRGSIFQITYFLGCDYKMIRNLYGQQSSNAIKG